MEGIIAFRIVGVEDGEANPSVLNDEALESIVSSLKMAEYDHFTYDNPSVMKGDGDQYRVFWRYHSTEDWSTVTFHMTLDKIVGEGGRNSRMSMEVDGLPTNLPTIGDICQDADDFQGKILRAIREFEGDKS